MTRSKLVTQSKSDLPHVELSTCATLTKFIVSDRLDDKDTIIRTSKRFQSGGAVKILSRYFSNRILAYALFVISTGVLAVLGVPS